MEKSVANFDIKYVQIMNEKGIVDGEVDISDDVIKKMYEYMILSRKFDETVLKLQREGRFGVYAPLRGQEACQIGAAFAMNDKDYLFPMYRDIGMMIKIGLPMPQIIQYFRGDERGMKIPENVKMFPFAITVAAQYYHASGAGIAMKIKGEEGAVLTSIGDGGTSKADFYEAMNFAGVFNSKTVFMCENNQFAISVRRENQTAAKTIAQKAIACGIDGIQVDGNDIFAVHKVVSEALEKARKGKPSFIELVTYRLADHTTADDASKYRDEKEVKEWEKKDPILRLELYMKSKNLLDDDYKKSVEEKCMTDIDNAIREGESIKPQEPSDIFKYMYSEMTPELARQLKEMENGN